MCMIIRRGIMMPRLAEQFNLEVQMQLTVISYGGILFERGNNVEVRRINQCVVWLIFWTSVVKCRTFWNKWSGLLFSRKQEKEGFLSRKVCYFGWLLIFRGKFSKFTLRDQRKSLSFVFVQFRCVSLLFERLAVSFVANDHKSAAKRVF